MSKGETNNDFKPAYDRGSGIRSHATFVRDKCPHHCTMPSPPPLPPAHFSLLLVKCFSLLHFLNKYLYEENAYYFAFAYTHYYVPLQDSEMTWVRFQQQCRCFLGMMSTPLSLACRFSLPDIPGLRQEHLYAPLRGIGIRVNIETIE